MPAFPTAARTWTLTCKAILVDREPVRFRLLSRMARGAGVRRSLRLFGAIVTQSASQGIALAHFRGEGIARFK